MSQMKLFFQALATYIVVDVAYQVVVGLRILTVLLEDSPLKDSYVQPTAVGGGLMLLFFALIAFANVTLVIKPALEAQSVRFALKNGAVLGLTAYGTLALTNAWSLNGSPLLFVLTIPFEGLLFSMVTSGLVTKWNLGKVSQVHTQVKQE